MESERRALLAIKSDMYDPGDRFSSWTGKDCCGWRGVACDNTTGHVTKLDLHYPYTYDIWDVFYDGETIGVGKVNPSLQELKHLKYLDLSMNNFALAPVPKMIASLVHLEYLNLSKAMFDGPIPPQFGNLSKLHHLDLRGWYDDRLHVDDLEWLSRIPSLKYLDMSEVNLSKATNWFHVINSIPTLEVLYLYHANLPYVPSPLPPFNLTAIATLDLSRNYNITSALIRWLSNATSLEYLGLSGCGSPTIENSIVTLHILASLGNLTNLQHLDLRYNLISGEIPPTVGNFVQLKYLDLYNNSITGEIPSSIGNLTNLVHLDLSSNNIIGSIPETIGDLQNLQDLNLGRNAINGQIPKMIGRLHRLQALDMSYNNLSGQIPMTMGGLCNLTFLFLSHNNIGGELTNLFDGLSTCSQGASLSILQLNGNNLSGIIPPSMGQLSQLQELDLSSNSLEGNITEAHFSNLTSLSELTVASNSLNVILPNDWHPSFSAETIDMSFCHIGAKFPDWIKTQQQLQDLYLSSNHLTGRLFSAPQSMLDLSNNSFVGPILLDFAKATNHFLLSLLSLSHNYINDNLPPFFCNVDSLAVLDLSNNHLIGEVPDCHNSFPIFLQSLHLNNNNLSGRIPSFLKYCDQLITLDLGENKFFDKILTWIGRHHSSLKVLRLRSNLLHGVIPENIVNLISLQVLDLSSNNLSGSLPTSLGNFTAMVEVQNDTRPTIEENFSYIESSLLITKGSMVEYTTILWLVTSIDLSNNHLSGEISKELTKLLGLYFLNLSNNLLTGRILEKMGDMKQLESLDLSMNNLTGEIPLSFSSMNFLARLNLSYNNLIGKIPTSGQLSTFDSWTYVGNKGLCGTPLPDCYVYQTPPDARVKHDDDDDKLDKLLECTSIVIATSSADAGVKLEEDDDGDMLETIILDVTSVVVGFIVVSGVSIGVVIMKQGLRITLFQLIDNIYGWMEILYLNMFNISQRADIRLAMKTCSCFHNEFNHSKYFSMALEVAVLLSDLSILSNSFNCSNHDLPQSVTKLSLYTIHTTFGLNIREFYTRISLRDCSLLLSSTICVLRTELPACTAKNCCVVRVKDVKICSICFAPFNLTAIARLNLSRNSNFTSTMLRWFSNTTNLEYLDLSHLEELDLSHNSLRGEVLRLHSNVRSRGLMHLDLSWNYLSGDITQALCRLRHSESLDLAGNIDNGIGVSRLPNILEILGNLTSSQYLSLSNNLISGEIPVIVGGLIQLGYIDLYATSITRKVPLSMGNLTNLVHLDISTNFITGQLPPLSSGNLTGILRSIIQQYRRKHSTYCGFSSISIYLSFLEMIFLDIY
ncbi:unnamed protein product [Musa textilis]